jgi:beta-glucanase (GH16 family)
LSPHPNFVLKLADPNPWVLVIRNPPYCPLRTLTRSVSFLFLFALFPGLSASADWVLVWSDEFSVDGPPNPAYWSYESGFVRNEELQWYQEENAFVENGVLVIEGRREQVPNPNYREGSSNWRWSREFAEYTSASIRTDDKISWQYGRLEVRARIKAQNGLWPAIWTLGVEGEWPDNGEVDIMEYYAGRILANTAWGTAQRFTPKWDSTKTPIGQFTSRDPDWLSKFHVWRMDWTSEYIRLYLDDELLNETLLSQTINADGVTNPFKQEHFLLLNLALGGAGGNPANTTFPTRYEVDWVRLYQNEDAAAGWRKVDDQALLLNYDAAWTSAEGDPGYLGTKHSSETAGSEMNFTFTGNQVRWYGFRRRDLGIAEVLLNGVSQAFVDCYGILPAYNTLLYESPKLPNTEHTLTIRVTGTQNPAARGTEVVIDALEMQRSVAGAAWQRRWFTDEQITQQSDLSGSRSDADLDGIPAIVEGLFGSNPLDGNSKPLAAVWRELEPGNGMFHFQTDRLIQLEGPAASYEFSLDLGNWMDISTWPGLEQSIATSPLSGYERIHYSLPANGNTSPLFIRKTVTE